MSDETSDGVQTGERTSPVRARRGFGEQPVVGEATFNSYYGQPIINQPVWRAPDIPGYLFLGGLAGASSLVAAGAQFSDRPALARASKLTSTVAISLGGAALVRDLGRPERFVNMLRVFKPTSPMNVGSWVLALYSPCSAAASLSAVGSRLPRLGTAATVGAAGLGSVIATYTAALIADTSVPAWHEGYRQLPFLFAASAASAAAGAGMALAPLPETGPVRLLATGTTLFELAALQHMKRDMGLAGTAFAESRKGRRYERLALTGALAGAGISATLARRSRIASSVAGVAIVAASALTRFAIFEAGLTSALDPKYTVVPQRQRLAVKPPSGQRPEVSDAR
jgi:formate-dependent nitrite reductase membrane component NrfD